MPSSNNIELSDSWKLLDDVPHFPVPNMRFFSAYCKKTISSCFQMAIHMRIHVYNSPVIDLLRYANRHNLGRIHQTQLFLPNNALPLLWGRCFEKCRAPIRYKYLNLARIVILADEIWMTCSGRRLVCCLFSNSSIANHYHFNSVHVIGV